MMMNLTNGVKNMTELGHNNPPPHEAFGLEIGELVELASNTATGGIVETQEQDDAIKDLQSQIKRAARDGEAARKAEKKPHDDAAKAVQARWKPMLDKAQVAAAALAKMREPFLQAQEAERKRIAEEKREEAARLEVEARAAFEESAPTDLDARFEAEEKAKQAQKAKATASKVERVATGLRSYWTATVTDYMALLKHIRQHDPATLRCMLDDYAERQKNMGVRSLAGVEFKEEKRAL